VIEVTALYPNTSGGKFDMDYYLNNHIPMVQQKLGAAIKSARVTRGLSGMAPGSPPAYLALAHILFESVEALQEAFGPHAEAIMAHVPNYTNTEPVIQLSEVKL